MALALTLVATQPPDRPRSRGLGLAGGTLEAPRASHNAEARRLSASWSQRGHDIDGEAADDSSGEAVSLSSDGTVAAIGAAGNDGNGSNAGHTRVYKWDGTSWNQLGDDIDGEASLDGSGCAVSLSSDGTVVAIGARSNDGTGSNAGTFRLAPCHVSLTHSPAPRSRPGLRVRELLVGTARVGHRRRGPKRRQRLCGVFERRRGRGGNWGPRKRRQRGRLGTCPRPCVGWHLVESAGPRHERRSCGRQQWYVALSPRRRRPLTPTQARPCR